MHVWALGLSCETPAAPPDRAAGARTRQPENSKRAHFRAPALQNTTKIPREDPQRDTETAKRWREREEKARNSGPPTLRAPPFGAPPFGAPPFGAPPFGAPLFLGLGPPPIGAPPFWAPPFGCSFFLCCGVIVLVVVVVVVVVCVIVCVVVCVLCVCCVCVCVLCVVVVVVSGTDLDALFLCCE